MVRSLLPLALLLPYAQAAVLEQLAAAPEGWAYTSTPSDSQAITLSVSLQQQNVEQLESFLQNVSTPGSASYGKYLDADQVNTLFAPSNQSVDAVMSWLSSAGVAATTDGNSVEIKTTVGTANSVLDADFLNYQDTTGIQKVRTLSYSVPDEVAAHVEIVTPTTFFGRTVATAPLPKIKARSTPRRERKLENRRTLHLGQETPSQINATCLLPPITYINGKNYTTIGPDCIKLIYNITYTPDPASGSRVGFGSFLNESARYEDLFLYEQDFGIPHQNFSVVLINGATNDQNASTAQDGEANLDVENIVGVSHPLPVTEFITGGSPPFVPNLDEATAADNENEPYLQYYEYLLSQPNSALPQVISNSYGDDEQTVPEKYAKRVCNLIGLMGLRGFTILESSGDTGVGAPCQSNDGKKTPQFTPTFPGTCPYITAVGGTQSLEPEIAWNAGSGGFSNYFKQAWYQKQAVETYLDHEISNSVKKYYKPYTNFKGRGFPDVSAHSLTPDYQVIENNLRTPSGGTSAASPVWAGVIALINDARLQAGKPVMGFLNPWLYSVGYKALTDITLGGSRGCTGINLQTGQNITGASVIPYASWNATVGWDPVTGFGVPNVGKLIELALAT